MSPHDIVRSVYETIQVSIGVAVRGRAVVCSPYVVVFRTDAAISVVVCRQADSSKLQPVKGAAAPGINEQAVVFGIDREIYSGNFAVRLRNFVAADRNIRNKADLCRGALLSMLSKLPAHFTCSNCKGKVLFMPDRSSSMNTCS